MAPEMVLGKACSPNWTSDCPHLHHSAAQGNSTVADLWSLGICLYEFAEGSVMPSLKGIVCCTFFIVLRFAQRSLVSSRLPATATTVASHSLSFQLEGFEACRRKAQSACVCIHDMAVPLVAHGFPVTACKDFSPNIAGTIAISRMVVVLLELAACSSNFVWHL